MRKSIIAILALLATHTNAQAMKTGYLYVDLPSDGSFTCSYNDANPSYDTEFTVTNCGPSNVTIQGVGLCDYDSSTYTVGASKSELHRSTQLQSQGYSKNTYCWCQILIPFYSTLWFYSGASHNSFNNFPDCQEGCAAACAEMFTTTTTNANTFRKKIMTHIVKTGEIR